MKVIIATSSNVPQTNSFPGPSTQSNIPSDFPIKYNVLPYNNTSISNTSSVDESSMSVYNINVIASAIDSTNPSSNKKNISLPTFNNTFFPHISPIVTTSNSFSVSSIFPNSNNSLLDKHSSFNTSEFKLLSSENKKPHMDEFGISSQVLFQKVSSGIKKLKSLTVERTNEVFIESLSDSLSENEEYVPSTPVGNNFY